MFLSTMHRARKFKCSKITELHPIIEKWQIYGFCVQVISVTLGQIWRKYLFNVLTTIQRSSSNLAIIPYGVLRLCPCLLLGTDHLFQGGLWFFSKKIFWFPMLLKKILWFWWRKKQKSDSEFLSYNLMLNAGKKICALRDKKIDILTLVLSEINFLNETKNHNPPCKLNGRSLTWYNM